MSGFDFRDLSRKLEKLNGLEVDVNTEDSVDVVVQKLRREIKRHRAYEPTSSELRVIAQDMLKEARR
ncbi:hypothetical protein [Pseudarthrobacter siccitolerans]